MRSSQEQSLSWKRVNEKVGQWKRVNRRSKKESRERLKTQRPDSGLSPRRSHPIEFDTYL